MSKKTHRSSARKFSRPKVSFSEILQNFKAAIEARFGPIDWKKVGELALTLILVIASRGVFGAKAAKIAKTAVQFVMAV